MMDRSRFLDVSGSALQPILENKITEVAALKSSDHLQTYMAMIKDLPPCRGFEAALRQASNNGAGYGLICEVKRKSPSAGEIRPGADPVLIAGIYENGGASCLSVLTDNKSFGGDLEDLKRVKEAVNLPLLRKDFMIDPAQIYEARASGADAILIIMSMVSDSLAQELYDVACECSMDSLVEVHTEAELERAVRLKSSLIGINNRDLKKMVTDLETTQSLIAKTPSDKIVISESGIKTKADIDGLVAVGVSGFLIGEHLMKQGDIGQALSALY